MSQYEVEKGKIDVVFIEYTSDVKTHSHSCMEIVYILDGDATHY